jgi:hypothetical protein
MFSAWVDPLSASDRVYCDEAYVCIRWDNRGKWVSAEWKGWANSDEFRAAHNLALVAIRENQATKWLVDSRAMRVVIEEDQRWLAETWIPSIVRAGIRWTAIVQPKSEVARLNVQNVNAVARSDKEDARFFTTLEEAERWLSAP